MFPTDSKNPHQPVDETRVSRTVDLATYSEVPNSRRSECGRVPACLPLTRQCAYANNISIRQRTGTNHPEIDNAWGSWPARSPCMRWTGEWSTVHRQGPFCRSTICCGKKWMTMSRFTSRATRRGRDNEAGGLQDPAEESDDHAGIMKRFAGDRGGTQYFTEGDGDAISEGRGVVPFSTLNFS